jgi:hypothetical protein
MIFKASCIKPTDQTRCQLSIGTDMPSACVFKWSQICHLPVFSSGHRYAPICMYRYAICLCFQVVTDAPSACVFKWSQIRHLPVFSSGHRYAICLCFQAVTDTPPACVFKFFKWSQICVSLESRRSCGSLPFAVATLSCCALSGSLC